MGSQLRLCRAIVWVACLGAAAACGEPSDARGAGRTTSTTGEQAEVEAPSRSVSSTALGFLLAGTNDGVVDRWDVAPTTPDALRDRSAVTVVGTFVGYELNPGYVSGVEHTSDPGIYVAGYAGPSGVLRLLFEVDTIVGGRAPNAVEAPGHDGEGVIAVDTEYWIPSELQAEHFGRVDELDGVRFALFLEGGEIAGTSTGAYRIWVPPLGVLAESSGELVRVRPDRELVERQAVARGAVIAPSTETTSPATSTTDDFVVRDLLTPLEGMTIESFVAEYQVVSDARLQPPAPTAVD